MEELTQAEIDELEKAYALTWVGPHGQAPTVVFNSDGIYFKKADGTVKLVPWPVVTLH